MIYKKLVKNISKSGFAINGKQTDLSNYYNKQEIDTQQEAQDKKITINKEKINYLDHEITSIKLNELNKVVSLKDNFLTKNNKYIDFFGLKNPQNENETAKYATDHITFSSENASLLIKSNGEVWNQDTTGDLPIKYNEQATNINFTNDNDIVNKKYVDNKFNSTIRFYKHEIRFFDSKQNFLDTIATPLNLQENIDFETIESERYLMTGTSNVVGGSNYITENNLPKKEWGFDFSDHYGRYGSYTYMLAPGNTNNVSIGSITQSAAGDISYSGGQSIERRQFKWNYGKDTPSEFLPKFQMVYGVKFLRNI